MISITGNGGVGDLQHSELSVIIARVFYKMRSAAIVKQSRRRLKENNLGPVISGKSPTTFPIETKDEALTIINSCGIISSSSSDEAKLFATIFVSNSILDDKQHPLPDSLHSHKTNLVIFFLLSSRKSPNLLNVFFLKRLEVQIKCQ